MYIYTRQKRLKLDDKSYKCVFLGMSEESKAYRLFDPIAKKVVLSKDVVFEENESWNWGRTNEEVKLDMLEWGDSDSDEERSDSAGSEDKEEEEDQQEEVPSSNECELSSPSSPEERNRRAPMWMQDYVSGERLSKEEDVQNLAMFISYEDPTFYEEAVKSENLRIAMDLEIEAIVKNRTWEPVNLHVGEKKLD